MQTYEFRVKYFDVPTQKIKERVYFSSTKMSILPVAKEFLIWYKGLPGVRNVTLSVFDLNGIIILEDVENE